MCIKKTKLVYFFVEIDVFKKYFKKVRWSLNSFDAYGVSSFRSLIRKKMKIGATMRVTTRRFKKRKT